MSNTVTLPIETRDGSKNPRELRFSGMLPATIYGKGMESVSVQVDKHNFVQTYKNNKDAVYVLENGKNTYKTIVKNVQYNYATQEELNIEFMAV